ncbi:hypothetical protein HK405_010588 [Cladochytrium tenue]|nr:hypothetical protein HK405_010588 [Cladochytrium tenue]
MLPSADFVCRFCRLPLHPVSATEVAALCRCPTLLRGGNGHIPEEASHAAAFDDDLSCPLYDPESPVLELDRQEESKFLNSDFDGSLFAFVVRSVRYMLINNELKRMRAHSHSGLNTCTSRASGDTVETISNGSLEDVVLHFGLEQVT